MKSFSSRTSQSVFWALFLSRVIKQASSIESFVISINYCSGIVKHDAAVAVEVRKLQKSSKVIVIKMTSPMLLTTTCDNLFLNCKANGKVLSTEIIYFYRSRMMSDLRNIGRSKKY